MKLKLLFPVFIFLLAGPVQAQNDGAKMTPKEIKLLIDSISASLKRWYIYPEKAELISQTLKDKYKSGAYNKLSTRRELANTMHNDMQMAHHDGHMHLMYAPGFEKDLLAVLPDSLQKQEDEMELNEERARNFYFVKTEILPGNVGYVRWDGFVGHTQEAMPTYDAAFKFVSNTQALIIDMRYNGGGSPETVNAVLNYFFTKKLPMNHIVDFKHDTVKNYTNPSLTTFKLNMPVYVLTSKRTFSGAEDFTYAMKYGQRATIVGDTTGGGAHPTGPVPLGQGFVLNIPNARSYHEVTGTNWEGTGIYPDTYIKGEQALEKAQLLAYKELLTKARDEDEKQQLQWQMTVAENKLALAKSGGFSYTNEELKKLCGDFKPIPKPGASPLNLSIILKGSSIYRSTSIPPDYRLVPINSTRFVYENDEFNRYMEFALDKDGHVTSITIYRPDGNFSYQK